MTLIAPDTLPRSARGNALPPAALREMLVLMHRIRRFETRTKELFLAGEIKGTAHSSIGQEAIAVGAVRALRPTDFVLTHHRGHGHVIAKGADIGAMVAELMGRATGTNGGLGGSMHIADVSKGILGANGIVGAGMGLGTGAAWAEQVRGTGGVGIAFFGDGAANEGLFHEAMNLCAVWRLPLVFLCENNRYGLTTRAADVTAGPGVAERAAAYGVPGERIDGNDVEAVFHAVGRAVARAREGDGPTLIEAMTYRIDDHSMRANLPAYRTDAEVEGWGGAADPLARLRARAVEAGAAGEAEADDIALAAEAEVEAAIAAARTAPQPPAPGPDAAAAPARPAAPEPAAGGRTLTYLEALTEGMRQAMEEDPRVVLLGEDVGAIGGIFGATRGLKDAFGERVRDTPISESVIGAAAVGAALNGLRPIAEAQLFDFVTLMTDAIVNQAAKARFMLGGRIAVPVVFRGPQGAGIRLAAQHQQSLESMFLNVPGLEVYAPASPYDAKGLMLSAVRSDNPVVFLEHKLLYLGTAHPVPEAPYAVPPGRARIVRPGRDATVVATMAMVERAQQAAERLAREGIEVEVLDPRTLRPFDRGAVAESLRRTHRLVVVHEAPVFAGFGAEIVAAAMEDAFDWLDAHPVRVGAPEIPVPYNDRLERDYLPDARDIARAVKEVLHVD